MIELELNQTASWKQKTGVNAYGESIFADLVTISVRWEGGLKLVRNKDGKEVVSQATVFCLESVGVDDVLIYGGRDHIVLNYAECPDLEGNINHREVYV